MDKPWKHYAISKHNTKTKCNTKGHIFNDSICMKCAIQVKSTETESTLVAVRGTTANGYRASFLRWQKGSGISGGNCRTLKTLKPTEFYTLKWFKQLILRYVNFYLKKNPHTTHWETEKNVKYHTKTMETEMLVFLGSIKLTPDFFICEGDSPLNWARARICK